MAGCPSCQVNGLMGLINCGAWFVTVGVGVVTIVVIIVGDGVIVVEITSVVVGTSTDVSLTVMILSTCEVNTSVIPVDIIVVGKFTTLLTFGVNICEDIMIVVLGSVTDTVIILVTERVMELVSLRMGEGEANSLVLIVVMLIILDMNEGVGVTIAVEVGSNVGMTDGIVTLGAAVSVNVKVGKISLLVKMILGDGITLGNIVEIEMISVGILLATTVVKLAVLVNVIVGEGISLPVKMILGVGTTLGTIKEGEMISVGTLLSSTMDDMVKLSVAINVMVGKISLLTLGVGTTLGSIEEGEIISVGAVVSTTMDIVGKVSLLGEMKLGVVMTLLEDEMISVGTLIFIIMVKLSVNMVGEDISLSVKITVGV